MATNTINPYSLLAEPITIELNYKALKATIKGFYYKYVPIATIDRILYSIKTSFYVIMLIVPITKLLFICNYPIS